MIKDTDLVDTAKVEGFNENTVPNYSLDDFQSHFRMTRSTFQVRCTHFDYPKCHKSESNLSLYSYFTGC